MEVYDGTSWVGGLETYRITSPTVTADTASRPGWAVLTFTGPGSVDVTGSGSAEVLVVAGGGGGGYIYGGGGGAGGSVSIRTQSAEIGTNRIRAVGGTGGAKGNPAGGAGDGGAGGVGRIQIGRAHV